MPKSPETLNRRLLRLREEYGLSQTQWAEALGVEQSQVSRWEKSARGEPEVSSLKNLGGHLGITVAAIIGDEQPKPAAPRATTPEEMALAVLSALLPPGAKRDLIKLILEKPVRDKFYFNLIQKDLARGAPAVGNPNDGEPELA